MPCVQHCYRSKLLHSSILSYIHISMHVYTTTFGGWVVSFLYIYFHQLRFIMQYCNSFIHSFKQRIRFLVVILMKLRSQPFHLKNDFVVFIFQCFSTTSTRCSTMRSVQRHTLIVSTKMLMMFCISTGSYKYCTIDPYWT